MAEPPAHAARPTRSVRARVVGGVLVVAAIGMAFAGLASYIVQRDLADARIDEAIAQEVVELRSFSRTGVDPSTREPFTDLETLLFVSLQRNVPDRNEAFLTLIDDEVAYYSPTGRPVELQQLDEVVEAARAATGGDRVLVETTGSAIGDVRLAAVPITVAGDPRQGVYVIGFGRDLEQAEVAATARVFAVVALVSLGLVAVIAWLLAGRLLRPLRELRDTAQRIDDTDLDARIEVTGDDDLADLARTFNHMLDRLQAAFAAQRELLDDVGHELRTPLTILRGHIELMDAGDAADVAATRELVLDELDRMNRLVDDLLVLAKSRRPDFLQRQPVAVAPLIDDVLDKARGLGTRAWTVDARCEASIDADPQRVTQALLQLVANAVRFTEEGGVIALGSSADDRAARIWVRDDGPGVDPAERDLIFTRFGRGAAVAGDEGSGLGLPIVAAIAEAHGGRLDLDTDRGPGARFVLTFPADPGPRQDDVDDEADHRDDMAATAQGAAR